MRPREEEKDRRADLPSGNTFRTYGPDQGIPPMKPGASGELYPLTAEDYEGMRKSKH